MIGLGFLHCLQYQPARSGAARSVRSAKVTTATNFRPLNMPSLYASRSAPSIPHPGASPSRSAAMSPGASPSRSAAMTPASLKALSAPNAAGALWGRMTGPQRERGGGASCAPGPGHYDVCSDEQSASSSPTRANFKFLRQEYVKKSDPGAISPLPGPGTYEVQPFGRSARGPTLQPEHQCFLSSEVRFGLGERSPGKVRRLLRPAVESGRGPSSIQIQVIESKM